MHLFDDQFACEWCGVQFTRRRLRGRRPLYCTHTCRQRAFEERRRGAHVAGFPTPTLLERRYPRPAAYQAGRGRYPSPVMHAMRPDGASDDRGRRPTLCGTRVRGNALGFRPGQSGFPRACTTCARVAAAHPPDRHHAPLDDIGTLTAVLATLRGLTRAPEDHLRRCLDVALANFGAPAGSRRAHHPTW